MGLKYLNGGSDPMKAENWIDIMKRVFKAMSIPHCHQARLGTCMLQEETSHWWKSLERPTFARRVIESMTWADFVVLFNLWDYSE